MAAVQHYNNPMAVFRSGNFIVLMIIAFTSLFHAYFKRENIDYVARNGDGTPRLTNDGEPYLWDALHCARQYLKGADTGLVRNIELMLALRHKIEHRGLADLDRDICPHCQAMLLNFEKVLVAEFTPWYSLTPSLTLALQFSTARSSNVTAALRRLQTAEYEEVKKYVDDFEASLPDHLYGDPEFAYRVWLVQKPANAASRAEKKIEFVTTAGLTPDQAQALEEAIVAVKPRFLYPATVCTLYEKDVVAAVAAQIGSQIVFGERTVELKGHHVRAVVKVHEIKSPTEMYYRPGGRAEARPLYGSKLVEWIVSQYRRNEQFFWMAHQVIYRKAPTGEDEQRKVPVKQILELIEQLPSR